MTRGNSSAPPQLNTSVDSRSTFVSCKVVGFASRGQRSLSVSQSDWRKGGSRSWRPLQCDWRPFGRVFRPRKVSGPPNKFLLLRLEWVESVLRWSRSLLFLLSHHSPSPQTEWRHHRNPNRGTTSSCNYYTHTGTTRRTTFPHIGKTPPVTTARVVG